MGLDISIYKDVKKASKKQIENGDYAFKAFVISDSWKDRVKNLDYDSFYVGKNVSTNFGCGYSSHGLFRDQLTEVTGKNKNWRNETEKEPSDFFELINFADNEGCLDWEVSEKLYNDFERNKNKALGMFADDDVFIWKYESWLEIFQVAKDNGVVVFH